MMLSEQRLISTRIISIIEVLALRGEADMSAFVMSALNKGGLPLCDLRLRSVEFHHATRRFMNFGVRWCRSLHSSKTSTSASLPESFWAVP